MPTDGTDVRGWVAPAANDPGFLRARELHGPELVDRLVAAVAEFEADPAGAIPLSSMTAEEFVRLMVGGDEGEVAATVRALRETSGPPDPR